MTFAFNFRYFLLTIVLLAVEILIALFVKDTIVRPFVGDLLVVILLYCLCRTFLNAVYWKTALGVFLFACLIEILQYFDYVKILGLEHNRLLSILMGRTFELADFAAYFSGFLIIIMIEQYRN